MGKENSNLEPGANVIWGTRGSGVISSHGLRLVVNGYLEGGLSLSG